MNNKLVAKDVDQWLDEVDYSLINSTEYVPSSFALQYINFIKLVNANNPEANKSPAMLLTMLDKIVGKSEYLVNLCFRGSAKTT